MERALDGGLQKSCFFKALAGQSLETKSVRREDVFRRALLCYPLRRGGYLVPRFDSLFLPSSPKYLSVLRTHVVQRMDSFLHQLLLSFPHASF
jgi:hypothetical protein